MKGNIRFLVKLLIFSGIFILLFSKVTVIFTLKEYPVRPNVNALISPYVLCEKQDGFYSKPQNSLDVVFIGSSNIHCNISPNVIWNQYGIASYNYSSDQQELGTSYFYLKQVFETQSPSVVVVDVKESGDTDSIDDLTAHFAFDHMKFDRVKVEAILSRTTDSRLEMFFPLITYHERWKELSEDDFKYVKNRENCLNGAFIYMPIIEQETPEIPDDIPYIELPKRTRFWLDCIVDLCHENNCECLFIKTPFAVYEEDEYSYFDAIQRYCDEKQVPFLYMNKIIDEIGIDYKTDYADTVHMNWNGQLKLSSYLGEYLSSNYKIVDKRNNNAYSQWEEDYAIMMEYVNNFWTIYWERESGY